VPVRLGAALLAEFIGTFALTFVGILAIQNVAGGDAKINLLLVALAHGIILSTMITATMPTSGGHLNPAVTFGFLITGKIKPPAAISYIVIQLLGSTVAALAVYALGGANSKAMQVVAAGTPALNTGVTAWAAVLAEIIATGLLVIAVWGSAADPRARDVGGFAIGLTVAADILAIGPITGASMNPARSFGPTLVAGFSQYSGLWKTHWVYWVGPLVGAGIAALAYHLILWPRDTRRGIDPGAVDVPPTQRPSA
jgi:MIP family channel proteins